MKVHGVHLGVLHLSKYNNIMMDSNCKSQQYIIII